MPKITELYYEEKLVDASEVIDTRNNLRFFLSLSNEVFAPYSTIEKICFFEEGAFAKKCRFHRFHEFMSVNRIFIYKIRNMDLVGSRGSKIIRCIKKPNIKFILEYELYNKQSVKNDLLLEVMLDLYWKQFSSNKFLVQGSKSHIGYGKMMPPNKRHHINN